VVTNQKLLHPCSKREARKKRREGGDIKKRNNERNEGRQKSVRKLRWTCLSLSMEALPCSPLNAVS
jgi:hypothetical protein